MADAVDFATDLVAEKLELQISAARAPVPAGVPGECDKCFEDMPRLVGGLCAFCRDGRGPRGRAS
jgi:hypothetical protein